MPIKNKNYVHFMCISVIGILEVLMFVFFFRLCIILSKNLGKNIKVTQTDFFVMVYFNKYEAVGGKENTFFIW